LAGAGLSAGLVSPAGAATPPAVATAPAPPSTANHPLRAWLRGHRKAVARQTVAISAKTIGISPKALVVALHSGQSIAEVASSKSVDVQNVVNALVQAGATQVGRAVDNHKLTQALGTKIEAALPRSVTKLVNHTFGQHSPSRSTATSAAPVLRSRCRCEHVKGGPTDARPERSRHDGADLRDSARVRAPRTVLPRRAPASRRCRR
jgi:prolyl-tRNA editing enzyme YbaK/EbsC (Cys-tRNA(Pro) deacylase)